MATEIIKDINMKQVIRTSIVIPFLTLLIILSSSELFAQQYYFDSYSVKDGLAQSKIYSIIQDHEGYIWLGTESGASQFDGIQFNNYTSDDSLAENGVRTVFMDSKNRIWFGHSGGGISIYDNGKLRGRAVKPKTLG